MTIEHHEEFQDWLRNFRIYDLDMTQSEFANVIGVTPGSIASWEAGRRIPVGIALQNLLEFAAERESTPPDVPRRRRGPRKGPRKP